MFASKEGNCVFSTEKMFLFPSRVVEATGTIDIKEKCFLLRNCPYFESWTDRGTIRPFRIRRHWLSSHSVGFGFTRVARFCSAVSSLLDSDLESSAITRSYCVLLLFQPTHPCFKTRRWFKSCSYAALPKMRWRGAFRTDHGVVWFCNKKFSSSLCYLR